MWWRRWEWYNAPAHRPASDRVPKTWNEARGSWRRGACNRAPKSVKLSGSNQRDQRDRPELRDRKRTGLRLCRWRRNCSARSQAAAMLSTELSMLSRRSNTFSHHVLVKPGDDDAARPPSCPLPWFNSGPAADDPMTPSGWLFKSALAFLAVGARVVVGELLVPLPQYDLHFLKYSTLGTLACLHIDKTFCFSMNSVFQKYPENPDCRQFHVFETH